MLFREPEAKWIKCQGRSPPSPRVRVQPVPPKAAAPTGLVHTLRGMCNSFPRSRLPKFTFTTNAEMEKEVMEGVLR